MSEYQYYEFVAMDRPLDDHELQELRALSTRATITQTGFVNEYHWGDLRADPRKLMERYFDVFFYFANWGSRRLMLRLPRRALDSATVKLYACKGLLDFWNAGDHLVVEFNGDDEHEEIYENLDWQLSSIVGVRGELAAGDLRVLYLSWLLAAQTGELDDDELEPPVPPGLGSLTASQRAFADFFEIDEDMITVSAAASQPIESRKEDAAALTRWIKTLPADDKDAMLLRIVRDNDVHLRAELLRQFHGTDVSVPGTRTVGEIIDAADALRLQHVQAERERQAEAERVAAEKAAAERRTRLEWLARNQDSSWEKVNSLIDTKKPVEYEKAVDLLLDLRAVSEEQATLTDFSRKFTELRERHQRKVSLLDRFTRAGLA